MSSLSERFHELKAVNFTLDFDYGCVQLLTKVLGIFSQHNSSWKCQQLLYYCGFGARMLACLKEVIRLSRLSITLLLYQFVDVNLENLMLHRPTSPESQSV